ncbi:APC family permease [Thiohalomonas denitrificans]|uniref:APC family permease n=1 Tax=Thiohalomonas denitrificans TaxID=415747 RepID=UPI0026E94AC7|nr:amino acid permease [Thiohalomonas denitrificans]
MDARPHPTLRSIDVVAIIVGLVIGAGIFKAPAVVAANAGSETGVMLSWLAGGVISIIGALCYAELSAAYPDAGGEYHFLRRAYGNTVGFLFAWSRLVVLQTGSIALLAFVMGDYAAQIVPLGPHGPALFAAGAVTLLTAINLLGLRSSKWVQNLLTLFTLGGLVMVIIVGLALPGSVAAPPSTGGGDATFGLAMVFVLLTYGGWNEAAYISAELEDVQRRMWKVLVVGIGTITLIYLLVNWAYLNVLGLEAMAESEAVTADLMRRVLGESGAKMISLLIVAAVFASINVTILTGARTNYALARDFRQFHLLGNWSATVNAPTRALMVQGVIALLLVAVGSASRSGFEAMVSYISPVFWLFFLLTTLSLLVLRQRDPHRPRPFRVPVYPYTPVLFAAACAYMFWSSLLHSGWGALLGMLVLAAGIPFRLPRFRRE